MKNVIQEKGTFVVKVEFVGIFILLFSLLPTLVLNIQDGTKK